jgi:diaminopimelate decarboxylase
MKFLSYKKKNFFVDKISIEKLSKKFKTPYYCYSLSQIKSNLNSFKNLFNKTKPLICFSVKSNSNIKILNELKKEGCGADVVSMGEISAALKSGIKPSKIVFSGVGKTEEELFFAIKKNILLINIESENEAILLDKISKKISKKISVGIRLNPNINSGNIRKISTGLNEDKFGLTEKNFLSLFKKITNSKNLILNCISVHIGSQILKIDPFKNTLNVLKKIINKTNFQFKYIDFGGGVGIPYENKNNKFNLKKYSALIEKLTLKHKCKIILEPGRFIIGNSATLVTKITYIKKTKNKDFIILDAGMNDLIRPALYDAKHLIVPSKKNNTKYLKNIEFVGPICETSDKFLSVKKYQCVKEKDFLLILDVGAYGMSLASNYCFRPKPAEILINKSNIKVIRKRENINKLIINN